MKTALFALPANTPACLYGFHKRSYYRVSIGDND